MPLLDVTDYIRLFLNRIILPNILSKYAHESNRPYQQRNTFESVSLAHLARKISKPLFEQMTVVSLPGLSQIEFPPLF